MKGKVTMHTTLKDGTIKWLGGDLYKVSDGSKERKSLTGKVPEAVVKLVEMRITSESAWSNAQAILTALTKGNPKDVFEVDFKHPEQGLKTCYRITRADLLARAKVALSLKNIAEEAKIEVDRIAEFETAKKEGGRTRNSGGDIEF